MVVLTCPWCSICCQRGQVYILDISLQVETNLYPLNLGWAATAREGGIGVRVSDARTSVVLVILKPCLVVKTF